MNKFKSYTRGIAYHTLRFKQGIIRGDEFYEAIKVILGEDVFKEVEKIMDENKKRS